MKVDGSCHCGAIAYTAEVDSGKVTFCHGNDCQILAGSAFALAAPAATGSFRLTKGEPVVYIKKTAASGRHRAPASCTVGATRVYVSSVNVDPPQITLRASPIHHQLRDLAPKRQIWCSAALDWAKIDSPERVAEQ